MTKIKKNLILFLKGITIGSTMLLPGLSGATTAILLNIYTPMLDSINNLRISPKKSISFLLPLCIGILLGGLAIANLLLLLLNSFPIIMNFLCFGIILGGIPIFIKGNKLNCKSFLFIILGISLSFSMTLIPEGFFTFTNNHNFISLIKILLVGSLLALALVLPGISFSFMLVLFSLYEPLLLAIKNLDIPFLAILGIAIILGIFISCRFVAFCFKKYPSQINFLILGFILSGSMELITFPQLKIEYIIGVIIGILALVIMLYIHKLAKQKEKLQLKNKE